jgi:hypothetical protein
MCKDNENSAKLALTRLLYVNSIPIPIIAEITGYKQSTLKSIPSANGWTKDRLPLVPFHYTLALCRVILSRIVVHILERVTEGDLSEDTIRVMNAASRLVASNESLMKQVDESLAFSLPGLVSAVKDLMKSPLYTDLDETTTLSVLHDLEQELTERVIKTQEWLQGGPR